MQIGIESILSNAQAVTATVASTGVYDVAGLGVGVATTNRIGNATVFGSDMGGGGPLTSAPQLGVWVTTTFTAGGAATLRVQLEAAVDNGSGSPGTWNIIDQSDDIPVADLTSGTPGQPLVSFTVPRKYPGAGAPRFYRVNYVVTTGPMTAGALSAALLTGIDDVTFYAANF